MRALSVEVDGVALGPTQFSPNAEQGWLTIGSAPGPGVPVTVRYAASLALDLAVSNWDSGIGEYLFRNRLVPTGVPPLVAAGDLRALSVAPNPARAGSPVQFAGTASPASRALVYSAEGRLVQVLPQAPKRVAGWLGLGWP